MFLLSLILVFQPDPLRIIIVFLPVIMQVLAILRQRRATNTTMGP